MRAMVLDKAGAPLVMKDLPRPEPGPEQVLVNVHACGVCRTDLHVLDGELTQTQYPIIPGHQVVGTVAAVGDQVSGLQAGARIGVPWLGASCRHCDFCSAGKENLCAQARFTGCQIDGGFAEYCVADYRYCFALPEKYTDTQVAPLLCAGLIGYRAWRLAGESLGSQPRKLGFMGFGASAHILAQLARDSDEEVFAFTRDGDEQAQAFASQLGAIWTGGANESPPVVLDAVIIFAPAGELVPRALALVRPGGTVVCAGIHMSTIPAFDYDLLWGERVVCSVANLTRQDGIEFMALAAQADIATEVHTYPLEEANGALADLKAGRFTGAAVIALD